MTQPRPHIRLRRSGLALRLLRAPLITTDNRERAIKSRWTWGERDGRYVMSTLAILHTLTGFYVDVKEDE